LLKLVGQVSKLKSGRRKRGGPGHYFNARTPGEREERSGRQNRWEVRRRLRESCVCDNDENCSLARGEEAGGDSSTVALLILGRGGGGT